MKLFRPDFPEPIDDEQYRRALRWTLRVIPVLAVLNFCSRWFVQLDPGLSQAAFDRFLSVNLPAHALVIVGCVWALRPGRTTSELRTTLYVLMTLLLWTGATGLWVMGSVTSPLSVVFIVFVVAGARVYADWKIGLYAFVIAVVLHSGLVALQLAGAVELQPLSRWRTDPTYDSPAKMIGNGAWVLVVYAWAYVMANYVAQRFRRSEHALRQLNSSLEDRVRDQVTQIERVSRLRRYLAPQLVERIVASEVDPVAVRERRHVTVMFADLQGFTALVERAEPAALAEVLNYYFDEVASIAFRHGGTIDKFIGDAVMVFFGAPEATGDADQALRCVRMAIEIQSRVGELGGEFLRRGAGGPLAVRIGIGSGMATVGAFGATHRADFTVVGTPVNRAARLEPLASPGGILVDEQTYTLLGGMIAATPHGEVALKGFAQSVRAFRIAMGTDRSISVSRA